MQVQVLLTKRRPSKGCGSTARTLLIGALPLLAGGLVDASAGDICASWHARIPICKVVVCNHALLRAGTLCCFVLCVTLLASTSCKWVAHQLAAPGTTDTVPDMAACLSESSTGAPFTEADFQRAQPPRYKRDWPIHIPCLRGMQLAMMHTSIAILSDDKVSNQSVRTDVG